MEKMKKTIIGGLLTLSLSACGGGGGSGGVSTVTSFVQNDLTNLSGSSSIVSSYSSLLSNFQSTISGGNYSSLQAILTGPDSDDIVMANTLLSQLNQAEALWSSTEDLISQQNDSDKYTIYTCNECGLIITSKPKTSTYECKACHNYGDFTKMFIPYACKLLFQELMTMSIAPRLLTN